MYGCLCARPYSISSAYHERLSISSFISAQFQTVSKFGVFSLIYFLFPAASGAKVETSNPQELLDQLSACCHSLSCMPNSLIVSVSALSHLAHIQFTWPAFLDNIKIAAGKSGTDESKNHARSWLSSRIEEDPAGARAILLHAGQLNALLIRFTFE